MTGHCDAGVLAEYRDGLLGRRRSARISAHLAGCARCSALAADLAEVSALLASVPPPPMPDELITRLDGVLAAESAARAQAQAQAGMEAASGAESAEGAGTVIPAGDGIVGRGRPARTRRTGSRRRPARATGSTSPGTARTPRIDAGRHPSHTARLAARSRPEGTTGPTGRGAGRPSGPAGPGRTRRASALRAVSVAAAVLALAGGGYGLSRLVQGGAGPSSAASGGVAAGPAQRPLSGTLPPNSAHGSAGSAITAPAATLPVVHSGTNYLPGRLAVQAQAVLARYPGARAMLAPVGNTAGPQGCASLVAGGARLRLVDVARYRGQPAIVIMAAAAGGRPGQIWVSGTGCPAAGRDLIAHARLTGGG